MAFDVGGIDCGLTFSFTIFILYFALTTLRLLSKRTKYFRWVSVFYYLQYITIPSILTLYLSFYQNNKIERFSSVEFWKLFIVNSTPIFTILEGFCSLLSIQAIGQIIQWLTHYKSDSWLILLLVFSGSTITGALYFLYRIYVLPLTIDVLSASLLGSFLTLTVGLSLYGILSGKGSIIESSLLFAYIVRCIYETIPQLSENASQAINSIFTNTNISIDIPMIPYISPRLLETLSTTLPSLAANLPGSFKTLYDFLTVSVRKLPLPVLLNFSYRITVFFAATKIIPALYHSTLYPTNSPPRTPPLVRTRDSSSTSITSINLSPNKAETDRFKPLRSSSSVNIKKSFQSNKPPSTIVTLIYSYSPCIIIPVYTHLLMLYNGELATHLKLWQVFAASKSYSDLPIHPIQFWNWINIVTTLLLYLLELGNDSNRVNGNVLTNHWKVD